MMVKPLDDARWNHGLQSVAVSSINILAGVAWLLGGLIWLGRATVDKARPSAPISSPAQPETLTEKHHRWGMWVNAVLYVMLGVLYLLKVIFSHRH
jgi:hypothetical protein